MRACLFRLSKTLLSVPAAKRLIARVRSSCACGADGHHYFPYAPSGVMGDHIHRKGGLMASYRYMFMSMQRNYDGDSQISDAAAQNGYMGSAAEMDMQMHMLGVMFAPSDKLTLMLMSAYKENSMLNNMMGNRTKMRSSGWGDATLSAYYGLYKKQASSAHVGLGLSAPTGSIDERMSNGARMGYPMQLGSGTWDLKPSLTWLGHPVTGPMVARSQLCFIWMKMTTATHSVIARCSLVGLIAVSMNGRRCRSD